MEFLSPAWLSALATIILIDIVLAGDNALVIALAARGLPAHLQTRAIVWGTVGAIAVRALLTVIVVWLLQIPGLMLMGGVGLSGRSFIPLLSSFACAIPGIMGTRVIENRRDRFTTILIAPLMSCSARLPVYLLMISAFVPDVSVAGRIPLQGITLFSMYILGALVSVPIASISSAAAAAVAPVSIHSSTSNTRVPTGQGSDRSSRDFSEPV